MTLTSLPAIKAAALARADELEEQSDKARADGLFVTANSCWERMDELRAFAARIDDAETEVTGEMLHAGNSTCMERCVDRNGVAHVYRAMRAAAALYDGEGSGWSTSLGVNLAAPSSSESGGEDDFSPEATARLLRAHADHLEKWKRAQVPTPSGHVLVPKEAFEGLCGAVEPFAAMARTKVGTKEAEHLRIVVNNILESAPYPDNWTALNSFCGAVLKARAALDRAMPLTR